jgi:hypothetical protein
MQIAGGTGRERDARNDPPLGHFPSKFTQVGPAGEPAHVLVHLNIEPSDQDAVNNCRRCERRLFFFIILESTSSNFCKRPRAMQEA